jgi:hypothetical protein
LSSHHTIGSNRASTFAISHGKFRCAKLVAPKRPPPQGGAARRARGDQHQRGSGPSDHVQDTRHAPRLTRRTGTLERHDRVSLVERTGAALVTRPALMEALAKKPDDIKRVLGEQVYA